MKFLPLPRKKSVTPQDGAHPQPVPKVEVHRPASPEKSRPPERSKRVGLALRREEASYLSRSIRENSVTSADSSPLPSPRLPNNCSVVSLASNLSVRERRSSSRSLELLRAAQDEGLDWQSLPPSPDAPQLQVIRKLSQWGEEAGSEAEKQQRLRLVRACVQVAQHHVPHLTIEDAELVVDLPVALGELTSLRKLTLRGLRQVTQLPELRLLPELQTVEVWDCPNLRLPKAMPQQLLVDGVVQGGAIRPAESPKPRAAPAPQHERRMPRALKSGTAEPESVQRVTTQQARRPGRKLLHKMFGPNGS